MGESEIPSERRIGTTSSNLIGVTTTPALGPDVEYQVIQPFPLISIGIGDLLEMIPPATYRDTWIQWTCGISIQLIITSVHRVYKSIKVYVLLYDNTVLPRSTPPHPSDPLSPINFARSTIRQIQRLGLHSFDSYFTTSYKITDQLVLIAIACAWQVRVLAS